VILRAPVCRPHPLLLFLARRTPAPKSPLCSARISLPFTAINMHRHRSPFLAQDILSPCHLYEGSLRSVLTFMTHKVVDPPMLFSLATFVLRGARRCNALFGGCVFSPLFSGFLLIDPQPPIRRHYKLSPPPAHLPIGTPGQLYETTLSSLNVPNALPKTRPTREFLFLVSRFLEIFLCLCFDGPRSSRGWWLFSLPTYSTRREDYKSFQAPISVTNPFRRAPFPFFVSDHVPLWNGDNLLNCSSSIPRIRLFLFLHLPFLTLFFG